MRKSVSKFFVMSFILSVFLMVLTVAVILKTDIVWAQKIKIPELQIPIAEFTQPEIQGTPPERYVLIPWIGEYISSVYELGIGAIGILATVMLMIGGFLWLTAAGSSNQIEQAKSFIWGAIIGLVLAFGSYSVLYLVNPALVRFEALKVQVIEPKLVLEAECLLRDYDEMKYSPENFETVKCCNDCQKIIGDYIKCTLPCYGHGLDETGIWHQRKDMSGDLKNLWDEIHTYVRGTMTSYSDDNIDKGTCKPWLSAKEQSYNDPNGCQHMYESCHYGGGQLPEFIYSGGFSAAMDIVTNESYAAIERISEKKGGVAICEDGKGNSIACDGSQGTVHHIHIGTKACEG